MEKKTAKKAIKLATEILNEMHLPRCYICKKEIPEKEGYEHIIGNRQIGFLCNNCGELE